MDFPAPAAQFSEVLPLTRTEVIKDADRITPLQQVRYYMASDEAASPCNQYQSTAVFGTHACSILHYAVTPTENPGSRLVATAPILLSCSRTGELLGEAA